MGILKKLLLVSVALSLSACSMFEGKNTFMTYQDLQDKVKTHDTELQDMKAKLNRIDELQTEVAELKKSKGVADSSQPMISTVASDENNLADGKAMAASDVVPAITVAPIVESQSTKMKPKAAQATVITPVAAPTKYKEKDNSYGVQLAAYGSHNEAVRGWQVLSNASPDTYVNLVPHVNEKQINGRTMYQLKVGPFLDRAYGADFCNMLKQKGQDCLVNKYDGKPL